MCALARSFILTFRDGLIHEEPRVYHGCNFQSVVVPNYFFGELQCIVLVIINISTAWAVDREFVHILGASGKVSNIFWHDFELFGLSGVCSGLPMNSLRWICGEG